LGEEVLRRQVSEGAEEDYYTPPDAARTLGISRRRVTQLLNEGILEGKQLDNGRWIIPAANVKALLKERSKRAHSLKTISVAKSVADAVVEVKDRAALLEHRLERLDDSFGSLLTQLVRLEDRIYNVERELKELNRRTP
jgi:septal ring factor EnvC (AmiA/AmiB activator)